MIDHFLNKLPYEANYQLGGLPDGYYMYASELSIGKSSWLGAKAHVYFLGPGNYTASKMDDWLVIFLGDFWKWETVQNSSCLRHVYALFLSYFFIDGSQFVNWFISWLMITSRLVNNIGQYYHWSITTIHLGAFHGWQTRNSEVHGGSRWLGVRLEHGSERCAIDDRTQAGPSPRREKSQPCLT